MLHVQPPLFDALRASLARLWPDVGRRVLVQQVDRALYLIWAVADAGIGVVLFCWLRRPLASARLAAVAALAFLLHPAAIYYGSYHALCGPTPSSAVSKRDAGLTIDLVRAQAHACPRR